MCSKLAEVPPECSQNSCLARLETSRPYCKAAPAASRCCAFLVAEEIGGIALKWSARRIDQGRWQRLGRTVSDWKTVKIRGLRTPVLRGGVRYQKTTYILTTTASRRIAEEHHKTIPTLICSKAFHSKSTSLQTDMVDMAYPLLWRLVCPQSHKLGIQNRGAGKMTRDSYLQLSMRKKL